MIDLVSRGRLVVHVVGSLTAHVAEFLGPASHTLATLGFTQRLVTFDEVSARNHLAALSDSVEVCLVPRQGGPLADCQALRRSCLEALPAATDLVAVHLHGLRAALAVSGLVRKHFKDAQVIVTSHEPASWHGLQGGLKVALGLSVRPTILDRFAVCLSEGREVSDPNAALGIEPPVDALLFNLPRQESKWPLVLAGGLGHDSRNFELVSQMAVLMSGIEDQRISFNCLGEAPSSIEQRLNACGVGMFSGQNLQARMPRYSSAWMALAAGPSPSFHRFVTEALASGLPCLALDHRHSRALLRQGVTGFLCQNAQDAIEHIALLIDNPELRQRMGRAARDEAGRQLTQSAFADRLLAYYDRPAVASKPTPPERVPAVSESGQ